LSDSLVTTGNQMLHEFVTLVSFAYTDCECTLLVNGNGNGRLADGERRRHDDGISVAVQSVNGCNAVTGNCDVGIA
jgi:hypothetical protein